ncbi:gliding motility protein GldM [Neptunitalea chrysea]|uniref:Gliding motility protein GldM n=1 Tax=Neptunitalea chrysea TaxID=1647581 RepID=A0A9W6EUP3_9FLAO|nr:gliding motility protein GldM [Neptunitalea chrysea]GLB51577.1 gliding motility protein GldM [Neptunitalea chrysea]
MAGGKLSPRQRMINLMYLVFIAMLALNMSKEVLSAFGLMTEKLEASNADAAVRNTAFMANLEVKSKEEPAKYEPLVAKANVIKAKGDDLYSFIESLKDEMNKTVDDPKEYEVKDKPDFLDEKFFNAGGLKPDGKKFLSMIEDYRNTVVKTIEGDYPSIAEGVDHKFSTDKVVNKDGVKVDWMNYNYEGYPMVASETKLTQLQADIKSTESEVLSAMLQGQLKMEANMNNFTTIMETPKPAYFASDKFDGSIVLGKTDAKTKPNKVTLTLDGRPLTKGDYEIIDGKVKLNIAAGNTGDHKIEGELLFKRDGEDQIVKVDQGYTVIPMPNSATIAADKMNVVYRGVANPMTVSFAGVDENKVSASAAGHSFTKSGNGYILKPGAGKEVTIKVNGTLPNGTSVSDSKKFRIKDLPKPVGSMFKMVDDVIELPKGSITAGAVEAQFGDDFDFNLPLVVKSFVIAVPGQAPIPVNGSKMSGPAKNAISKAKRGDVIRIIEIKASAPSAPGVKIQKVAPISIEVQ